MTSTPTVLRLAGDVAIHLLLGPDREFRGLGAVTVGGVPLRDPAAPLLLRIDTPTGELYTRYVLDGVRPAADGATDVVLRACPLAWGRQEFTDEYEQPLQTVALPTDDAADRVTLRFAPLAVEIGGRAWRGFGWSVRFESTARQIRRVLVRATWELGGRLTGNTVLHQGQCNRPVYRGAAGTVFTTTCLKTLEQYGSAQGVSYQLGPRGGLLQAFDFQHGPAGALLHFWPEYGSISSLLESPAGVDRLHVLDEYRFPLAREAATTPQHVLFCPGPLAEHEARDLWWDAYQHVYGGIRARFGVAETVVRPEAVPMYSTRVTPETTLRMTIAGEEVDSREVLHALADRVLPRLAAAGFRRFFPEVVSESDVTVLGMRRKLDAGVHGDLHCASVCATHRFLPAEFWGGMKGWRYLYEKAQGLGIELGTWFAPHFSPRSSYFDGHPEYHMTEVNSTWGGGGYGFQTIVTADWNTPVYDLVLADLRRWQEEGGLDYLFTDSWANLGLLQVNYAQGMRTNLERLGRLYHDLQALGIRVHSFEGISPFGCSRFGMADLRGDLLDAAGGIVGQNDFGWWVGQEDMAFNICMHLHPRRRDEDEVRMLLFRLLANRGYLMLPHDALYNIPEWRRQFNLVYEQALPHMRRRRLLPDGAGVLWLDGDVQVVWACRAGVLPVPAGARVEELTSAGPRPLAHAGQLPLAPLRVYRIAP